MCTSPPHPRNQTDNCNSKLLENKSIQSFTSHSAAEQQRVHNFRHKSKLHCLYKILCSCDKVYIGQTNGHAFTVILEYIRHTRLENLQSAESEHYIEINRGFNFDQPTSRRTVHASPGNQPKSTSSAALQLLKDLGLLKHRRFLNLYQAFGRTSELPMQHRTAHTSYPSDQGLRPRRCGNNKISKEIERG